MIELTEAIAERIRQDRGYLTVGVDLATDAESQTLRVNIRATQAGHAEFISAEASFESHAPTVTE